MAKVWADRVKETTATTGTGTITLAGAVAQHQSFSEVGNSNTCDYCLLSGNNTDWETGEGTYTAAGTTLSRDTVYASSNGGAKINLAGTSTVFVAVTARRVSAPATYAATPADPATFTSTTGVMMGFAGSITPAKTGNLMISAYGSFFNNTANRGVRVRARYGTGAAPSFGAASTGTAIGGNEPQLNNAGANVAAPFALPAIVTGLTVGTAYWIDLEARVITSGTGSILNVTLSAFEF